jgi:hypothetical protein
MFLCRSEKIKRSAAVRQRRLQFLYGRNLVADLLRVSGLGGRTLDLFRVLATHGSRGKQKYKEAEYG